MNENMKKLMISAAKEFGATENISAGDLQKKWERWTAEGSAQIASAPSDLRVRNAIMGLGTILKEDLEKHTYITTIKIGACRALAVTMREDADVSIVACAHEGLINQHIADKAVNSIKERINKLSSVN